MKNDKLTIWRKLHRVSAFSAAIFGLFLVPSVSAQDAEDEENLDELEGFVVTGSLIRRMDVEGPAPVLSLSREDIEASGFQQISDLIRSLPMNSGLTEADATASFAADGAYANLRGIGPNGTLVLVNGRRLAPYGAADFNGRSFVDLNSFPPGAIERVDVLKTGASAIYGSDALGGAINIILREDYEGLEVDAFYGNTTRSGNFETKSVTATVGTSSARGSLILIANYFEREPMFMRDREMTALGNFDDPFDFSANLGTDGYYDFRKISTGQGYPGQPSYVSSASYPGRFDFVTADAATGDTYVGGYLFAGDGSDADQAAWEYANYNDFITLYSGANRKGLVALGNYEMTDTMEFFIEANYQSNYGWTQFAPAPSFGDWTVPAENPYNPTNPANTAYYQANIFTRAGIDPASYPNGADLGIGGIRVSDAGPRIFQATSDFYRFVTGVEIEIESIDWIVEPSFMYVESSLQDATRNLLIADNVQDALNNTDTSSTTGDPSLWALNPFASAPGENDNPSIYEDFLSADDTRLSTSSLTLYEMRGNGPIFDLPAGTVSAAVGAEWRTEKLEDRPSLASQQGQLIGSGGTSSDGSRDAWAVYTELYIPVLDFVEVQAAARYEDYDDFGDTGIKPQLGVKVDVSEDIVVRAAYADNFKAPSLSQAYAGVQRGFLGIRDLVRFPITQDPFDDIDQQKETRTGGNPVLSSEESESFSVGLIYAGSDKLEGLELAIDYWRIEASNLITTLSEGQVLEDEAAAWEADNAAFLALSPQERLSRYNVLREPNETFQGQTIPGTISYINSVYLNLDSLVVEGFDFDVSYTYKTADWGTYQFQTVWTYFADYEENDDGFNEVGSYQIPKWRGNAAIYWNYGDWNANLLAYYVDDQEDLFGLPEIQDYVTFDIRVSYAGLWDTEVTVGIDNVFDTDPPFKFSDNNAHESATADLIGRFLWVSLKKAF